MVNAMLGVHPVRQRRLFSTPRINTLSTLELAIGPHLHATPKSNPILLGLVLGEIHEDGPQPRRIRKDPLAVLGRDLLNNPQQVGIHAASPSQCPRPPTIATANDRRTASATGTNPNHDQLEDDGTRADDHCVWLVGIRSAPEKCRRARTAGTPVRPERP